MISSFNSVAAASKTSSVVIPGAENLKIDTGLSPMPEEELEMSGFRKKEIAIDESFLREGEDVPSESEAPSTIKPVTK